MSVIDSYLDTLFSPYPDSARMQDAKAELRAMMEDKHQGLREDGYTESQALGTVIAEFGSLEELAPVLGIDREVHGNAAAGAVPQAAGPPRLGLERAEEHAEAVRLSQPLNAIGIPLFVLSPVPLLLLIALSGTVVPQPANWAVATGLVLLLVMVAVGVLLLVQRGSRLADFEDIEEGEFTVTPQVLAFARGIERENRTSTGRATAIAIALWILCAIPTVVTAIGAAEGTVTPLYGVTLTLIIVALGLFIYIRSSWPGHIASVLRQEEDYEDLEQSSSPAIRVIAAVYWPVIVAIYLGWSFLTGDWEITWVIWPIAGVLYAALWGVNAALAGNRSTQAASS